MPARVYFIITATGNVESTHLSLKEVSTHLKQFGSFSQRKIKTDLGLGAGRVHYQLPCGRVLLKEEVLAGAKLGC